MNRLRKFTTGTLMAALMVAALAGCGGDSGQTTGPTPIQGDATATSSSVITTVGLPETPEPEGTSMVGTPDPVETTAPADPSPTTAAMETTAPSSGTAQATSGTSTGTLTGPVADLFSRSEQAMRGVTSYHMTIETDSGGIKSQSEADVEVPDKMRMMVKTDAGSTELIMIGGESFTQVPGTDTYLSLPVAADMGSLRDSTSVLAFADTAEIVGDETVDGVETTHVRFSYDQDKASQDMAEEANLPTAVPGTLGRANAEVWIAKSTGYFHKYMVTTTGQAASTSTITFSNYNEPITPPIEKPTNVTTMPSP